MTDNFQIELYLRNAHCDRLLGDGFAKLQEGLNLISLSENYLADKRYDAAARYVFEGLGWICVSGIGDNGRAQLARERAAFILSSIPNNTVFLSDIERNIYHKIALLTLTGDALYAAEKKLFLRR